MDLVIHLCISQESKLFLSLLIFVLGLKEMEIFIHLFVQHDGTQEKQKAVSCVFTLLR